ncbi:MAG: phage tail tape measure protein [Candidatus Competibacter sp.]
MAASNDLILQLVIKAVDLATKDIDGVHEKLESLRQVLAGNEFDRSAEGMRAFSGAVKDSTDPLALAAKNTLALSAAMTGVASYMASQAYQASKDYESALADLAKVLDGDKEKAKQYGDQLNRLALSYSQNGQQLVASMANFVQAGYDAKEAFDLVEQSVKLMIAGELEAGESSDYLVSILKGFKAPASEAAATVDLLNEVSNKYATDVKQLAIGMAGISPIARQMGLSMEETAGLLTPVIEVYRSGSEAADALKTGLQALTDDTAPVKAALDSIGVSQLDLNGKLRSGKDIFLDVAKAMLGLDAATKQFVIQQLVGVEQAGRMTQVFDNLSGYLGVTEAAINSAGSALKEIESRLDTAEAKGRRAEESFRQLAVTLGNTFKPQIAGVIGATGDLAAAFDRAVKAGDLAPLLNVIKPQIAAVENLFQAMANNLEGALAGVDWRPLTDAIKEFSGEFGEAMAALTDGMDLSSVEGLRNLLQALINLMGNFTQYIAGVVDGLEPFLDSLNILFKTVSDNSPTLANLAGQITGLATSANQVLPVISSLGGAIFGAVGQVVELSLKIGLLVGGLKLLSAAGIPVGSILGGLLSRFLALNPAVAGLLSSLAGLPGLVVGLAGAAGGLGYAIGTVVNKTVEWASGGQSIGTMLYDLIHGSDEAEKSITRVATAEELAAAAAQRHARELAAKEEAERKAAEASEKLAKGQQDKVALTAEEAAAIERLKDRYAELGLVWTPFSEKMALTNRQAVEQKVATLELAKALDKVGVEAGVMSGRMTAAGDEMLKTLNGIAANAQASGKQINAAILAMVPKLETEAELEALRKKIEQLGKDGKLTGEQVGLALDQIGRRASEVGADPGLRILSQQFDEAGKASSNYTSALEKVANAQISGLRAEIDLANAKGQTWVAQQKTAELAQLEAQWTQTIAAAKQLEIAAEKASVEAKIAELQARAEVTDAVQREISALQLKMAALGQEAEAQKLAAEVAAVRAGQQAASASATTAAVDSTQQHTRAVSENSDAQEKSNASMSAGGGFAKAMADALNFARQQTEELSGATKRLFERMLWTEVLREPTAYSTELQKVVIELDKMPGKYDDITSKIAQMNATIRENQESLLFAPNSAARFIERLNIASAAAQKAWLEQKLAAEQSADAIERLANSGTASMHALDLAIRSAAGGYSLLDQQDMSRLNSALDQARSKLAALEEAARSAEAALSEMGDNFQRQILQAQGDQRRLLDLEHEDNLKRLEELHQKAGQLGGDEYAQAKARADALHSLKLSQLAAEEAAKRRQEAESRTPRPTGGGGGTGTAGATGGGTTSVTNNFYLDPSQLTSEEWYRQKVLPIQEKVARLRR